MAFFSTLRQTAEQFSRLHCWYRLLARSLVKYLNGRQLKPPAAAGPGVAAKPPIRVLTVGRERSAAGANCSIF